MPLGCVTHTALSGIPHFSCLGARVTISNVVSLAGQRIARPPTMYVWAAPCLRLVQNTFQLKLTFMTCSVLFSMLLLESGKKCVISSPPQHVALTIKTYCQVQGRSRSGNTVPKQSLYILDGLTDIVSPAWMDPYILPHSSWPGGDLK